MNQITEASIRIRLHATTNTPDLVERGLIVGDHVAAVEVHDPRAGRILGIRRRRPVEGRPTNVQERMPRR